MILYICLRFIFKHFNCSVYLSDNGWRSITYEQQPQSKNAASVFLRKKINLHLLRALNYFFFLFFTPKVYLVVCMLFLKSSQFRRFCDVFFCMLCVLLTWKLPSADWTAATWFLHLDLPLRER